VKITDVQAIPLFIPLKETPPMSISGKASAYHVLVKVFTDEGITGYGEAPYSLVRIRCRLRDYGIRCTILPFVMVERG